LREAMSDIGIWLSLVVAFAGGMAIGALMVWGYMDGKRYRP
jgi:hypothetical protein